MRPIYLIIAVASLTFASCKKCKDEKLTIPLAPYIDSALRVDGYYYYLSESSLKNNDTFYDVLVPFSDGKSYYFSTSSLVRMEEGFTGSNYARSKGSWGAFKTEGGSLMVEYWSIGFGARCWHLNVASGRVFNDTTFIIDTETSNEKSANVGHVYHFKQCSAKPSPDPEFYN